MRKSVYTSLLLLSVLTLAACGQQQVAQNTSSSSSSVTVASSSSASSSSSTAVESSSSTESSDDASSTETEAGRFDLDLASLEEHGYTAPANMDKYIGSYSAQALDDVFGEGVVVDLVINEDGTYRKLAKEYRRSTDENSVLYVKPGNARKHSFFDADDKFHLDDTPVVTVAGVNFLDAPNIRYNQGVLVEKFGDIYLVDIFELGRGMEAPYVDQTGAVDNVGTLLGLQLDRTMRQDGDGNSLPTANQLLDMKPDFSKLSLSENLEALISIKGEQIASKDFVFSATKTVSPLVQSNLSELFTDETISAKFENLNGIFQLKTTSYVGALDEGNGFGEVGGSIKLPELLDWSKIYSRQTGQLVTPGIGYRLRGDATMLLDNAIYTASEEDGKFIISD